MTYNHLKLKYLHTNLRKHIQDLYSKNYGMLMKEIKDENKWERQSVHKIGRLNIKKMSILPKLIYSFNRIPIKISPRFFVDRDHIFLKLILTGKGTRIVETILENTKWEESLYQISRLNIQEQILVEGQVHRSVEWNGEPRNGPTQIFQMIFDKGRKPIYQRKSRLFKKRCGYNWTSMGKKIN